MKQLPLQDKNNASPVHQCKAVIGEQLLRNRCVIGVGGWGVWGWRCGAGL